MLHWRDPTTNAVAPAGDAPRIAYLPRQNLP